MDTTLVIILVVAALLVLIAGVSYALYKAGFKVGKIEASVPGVKVEATRPTGGATPAPPLPGINLTGNTIRGQNTLSVNQPANIADNVISGENVVEVGAPVAIKPKKTEHKK